MGLKSGRRGSESRFAAYVDALSSALGHADRAVPFHSYCAGLLLPGDRKSVEPMAARLQPGRMQAAHQSLHHFVAKSDWSDDTVLAAVRAHVLPLIAKCGPICALIIDDTGIPKKGRHSAGVARQYCGQLGKQDNCQVAVSLSAANDHASLPIAYRLYLPRDWADDPERRAEPNSEVETEPRASANADDRAVPRGDKPPLTPFHMDKRPTIIFGSDEKGIKYLICPLGSAPELPQRAIRTQNPLFAQRAEKLDLHFLG
jgi:SRSO17 transposase